MKNIKETIRNIIKEESEYQQFFRKSLEKAGKSITDMSDEEKKAFFNKIDAAWDGKGEKNEGNAFGAAVTKAKEEGDDEFTVDGKTYPVKESVNDIKPGDVVSVTRKDGKLYKGKVEKTNPLKIRTSPSDTVVIGNNMIKSVIKEAVNEGKFKVDDLVYNTKTKTVGIVRMGDDKYGEVKTDADGNVDVDDLEKYNPIKFKHQTKAKVAPSTEKEVNTRGLFNPFKLESVNEAELPKNGSTIKVSNIPVKIEYVSGGKYIGYSWKDKNNKEHYEETKVSNHTDLNSLIKTITAEIRYQRIHKNESVNEATLKPGTKLRYEKNNFVIDYVVDKKYTGKDGFDKYILKVVKSTSFNYPNKIKVGSTEEYEDSRLTGLIRNGVIKFVKNESINESKYSDQTGIKSSLLNEPEFTKLFQPKVFNWMRSNNVKIFKVQNYSTIFTITDGKMEIVINTAKPMSVIKPYGRARGEVKNLFSKTETVNEYDEWKNTRTQSKNIFRMLKQKYNNNISKMRDGLEDILKQNKTKNDQAEVIRDEFNKFFKIKTETVNENFSNDDIAKIKGAVESASSFMGIGSELKKLGMKYNFATEPLPLYMIKKGSKTFVLVNKKYADKPDFVVGDTAGGLLESKSVNEVTIRKGTKIRTYENGKSDIVDYVLEKPNHYNAIKGGKTNLFKVINSTNSKVKVGSIQEFSTSDLKGMIKNHIASVLESKSVNETQFKSGDKVLISHPTMIKPFKGIVSTTLNAKGEEVLVLKGDKGVWDAKFAKLDESAILKENIQYSPTGYVKKMVNAAGKMVKDITLNGVQYRYNPAYKTYNSVKGNELLHKSHILGESVITEGNAFGMAVTAAKKEGKKEFEFNGKTYKIKKGSYEKNEAAKKLAEKAAASVK